MGSPAAGAERLRPGQALRQCAGRDDCRHPPATSSCCWVSSSSSRTRCCWKLALGQLQYLYQSLLGDEHGAAHGAPPWSTACGRPWQRSRTAAAPSWCSATSRPWRHPRSGCSSSYDIWAGHPGAADRLVLEEDDLVEPGADPGDSPAAKVVRDHRRRRSPVSTTRISRRRLEFLAPSVVGG